MSKPKNKFTLHSSDPKISDISSNKKKFSPKDLNPITPQSPAQKAFFQAYDDGYPVIVSHGMAGSGKTMIALHAMLKDLLEHDVYKKLIIIRSSVQARDIGFLPGTMEEKNEVYEVAYKNMFNELFKYKSNNYNNMKATFQLEFYNTSFLRGMTFDNSLILVDEFQSMSYHELSTIITRLGLNSRIVFCGDEKQCDLNDKRETSGIDDFLDVLENMQGDVAFIDFTVNDIVRSGIVQSFLIAEHRTLFKD